MDKLPARLRPNQISPRVQITFQVAPRFRATLSIPLAREVGVEQPVTTLLVHHLPMLQHPRQVVHRHRQLLGNLRRRQAAHTVEHLVTVLRLRLHRLDLVVQRLDLLAVDGVRARLTDQRQHLTCHPALEGLRLLQLRREDQCVETTLVDDDNFLWATDGVTNRYPILSILIVHMVDNCLSRILVP